MTPHQQLTDILAAADCHHIHSVYAGIGSRKTPDYSIALIRRISRALSERGWTLRSGGADGADAAFAKGIARKDEFLPWPNFNDVHGARLNRPTIMAMDIASQHHPNWKNLGDTVRRLHARNVHQILGANCKSPCAMVVCWTPDGSTGITTARTGGTGQALRIAYDHKIPIFNLQRHDHREAWEEVIR